jgi:hypothetical protein
MPVRLLIRSIFPSGAWDFGTSVEADTLTSGPEGGNAVWNDADTDVVDDTHLNWASMTYLGEEGQPTAAAVGLASDNLDDTDASIEWEDAADLESDGAISDNAVDYSATAGSYKAAVLVGDPDSWSLTTALHYGGTLIASADGEDTLDAVAAGMALTLQADDGVTAVYNPNAADTIIRNGVSLAQGEALVTDAAFGICTLQYRAANTWDAVCDDGMTEETP